MSLPVTVIVARKVHPGCGAEYEVWLNRLVEGASRDFAGYLGAEFHRAGPDGIYRSIFRFDNVENLEAFEQSEFRRRMMHEGAPLFAADAVLQRMTGLEFWFDPPAGTRVPQPSPHRMALVLIAVVFCLVLLLNLLLGQLIANWPMPVRVLLLVSLQVVLMIYVIMPRLTPRIASFIYPTKGPTK